MIAFPEFEAVYREAVEQVLRYYTPDMQKEMARHNVGWSSERTDFRSYLHRSAIRFYIASCALLSRNVRSICDVGGFWGVLPLTLRRLGVPDVAMTETLAFYGDAFEPLFTFLRDSEVTIHNFDPFGTSAELPDRFEALTLMAVVEHYPHSVKSAMETLQRMMRDDGCLYVEVPNIAYLPNRLALLRGRSPLTSIEDIYQSSVPFIGHHHEFGPGELRRLCELAGLEVEGEWAYNYSTDRRIGVKHGVRAFVESTWSFVGSLLYAGLPGLRECFSALCSHGHGQGMQNAPRISLPLLVGTSGPARQ